ncbi:MAG: hypothetical protein PW843_29315 [Azospirillaceae bacterium]|nr:hypothetical protein [Azospirillaceae bacterium]
MVWFAVLKFAGPKLGTFMIEGLIDKIGGEDAQRLKASLLGKDDGRVEKYFKDIDKRLTEIKGIVQSTELELLFANYNKAHEDIGVMRSAFEAHLEKPINDQDRQNACRDVLRKDGVLRKARDMIVALTNIKFPSNKSTLSDFSKIILRDNDGIDVFSYCERMRDVTEHLKVTLLGVSVLHQICQDEIIDRKLIKDVEIAPSEIVTVDNHLKEIIKPWDDVRSLFNRVAEGGGHVVLQHWDSKNYLTGYGPGEPLSDDVPFVSYYNPVFPVSGQGMPQIFVHEQAKGQVSINKHSKLYFDDVGGAELVAKKLLAGTLTPDDQKMIKNWLVVLEPSLQQWRVVRKHEGDATILMFVHVKSGQALAGVTQSRIYLSPFDPAKELTWWQPVLTKNGAGKYDDRLIVLKHWGDHKVLDANGTCVYSGNRTVQHDNKFMKWHVEEGVKALVS